jgi:hypothetical protein
VRRFRRVRKARYEHLLCEVRPEVIETDERCDEVSRRLAELVRKGKRRTSSDTRLMKLLAVLIEDYNRRHSLPPDDSSPAEKLRHLLEICPLFSVRPGLFV